MDKDLYAALLEIANIQLMQLEKLNQIIKLLQERV